MFRAAPATEYRKIRFMDGAREHGRLVELLAGPNAWFVAHGIHPVTGEFYRWPDDIWEKDKLSFVTGPKIEKFFDRLKEILPAAKPIRGVTGIDREKVDQATLIGDPVRIVDVVGTAPSRASSRPSRRYRRRA